MSRPTAYKIQKRYGVGRHVILLEIERAVVKKCHSMLLLAFNEQSKNNTRKGLSEFIYKTLYMCSY